jgi:ferredoxin
MRIPVLDMAECIRCEVCVELAPHAFQINDAGFFEVLPLDDYSDEDIHEAVKKLSQRLHLLGGIIPLTFNSYKKALHLIHKCVNKKARRNNAEPVDIGIICNEKFYPFPS